MFGSVPVFAILSPLLYSLVTLFVLYWVIRLAVRHALRDVEHQ
jgi:hypothetical protein